MTSIARIKTTNWKGRSDDVAVGPLNLLVGPNGSGKTALLEAVRFACTGKTSAGGTNDATVPFVGVTGGSVTVTLADGFSWTRALHIDHAAAKVSQSCTIHDGKRRGVQEASADVAGRVGDFAPMFDLGAFLGLSADRRRDYVMSLCAGHVDVAEAVLSAVKAAMGTKLEGGPYDARLLADAQRAITSAYKRCSEPIEGLSAALETCRAGVNDAAARKDEGNAAARALAERRAQLAVAAGTLAELRAEADRLDGEVAGLSGQIAEARGRATAAESLRRQIADHNRVIAEADAEITEVQRSKRPDTAEAARLESQADNLRQQAEAIRDPNTSRDALFTAEEAVASATGAVGLSEQAVRRAGVERHEAERLLKVALADPWVRARELAVAVVPQAQSEPARATLLAYIDEQAHPDAVDHAREAVARGTEAEQAAGKALESNRGTLQRAQEAAEVAKQSHRKACDLREANASERVAIVQRAVELDRQARVTRHDAEAITTRLARAGERIMSARQGIIEVESRLIGIGELGQTADIETRHAAANAQRDELRDRIESKAKADELDRELARCGEQAKAQEQLWTIYRAYGLAIKGVRETVMADLVSPLRSRMDQFIDAACPGYQSYCRLINDRGKPIFEMGWKDADRAYPFDTLPGGFKAIFSCALAYALVAVADVPCRLVLCEVAEVDRENMARLLEGFGAVTDDLSNVMLATHLPVEAASGWNLVRCNEAVGVLA